MADLDFHTRANGSCPYDEYVNDVLRGGSKQEAAKIRAVVDQLGVLGSAVLTNMGLATKMNDVWELRVGRHRVFYFLHADTGHYVILNGFRKQTRKTPPQELQKAENLRAEHLRTRGRK